MKNPRLVTLEDGSEVIVGQEASIPAFCYRCASPVTLFLERGYGFSSENGLPLYYERGRCSNLKTKTVNHWLLFTKEVLVCGIIFGHYTSLDY